MNARARKTFRKGCAERHGVWARQMAREKGRRLRVGVRDVRQHRAGRGQRARGGVGLVCTGANRKRWLAPSSVEPGGSPRKSVRNDKSKGAAIAHRNESGQGERSNRLNVVDCLNAPEKMRNQCAEKARTKSLQKMGLQEGERRATMAGAAFVLPKHIVPAGK